MVVRHLFALELLVISLRGRPSHLIPPEGANRHDTQHNFCSSRRFYLKQEVPGGVFGTVEAVLTILFILSHLGQHEVHTTYKKILPPEVVETCATICAKDAHRVVGRFELLLSVQRGGRVSRTCPMPTMR